MIDHRSRSALRLAIAAVNLVFASSLVLAAPPPKPVIGSHGPGGAYSRPTVKLSNPGTYHQLSMALRYSALTRTHAADPTLRPLLDQTVRRVIGEDTSKFGHVESILGKEAFKGGNLSVEAALKSIDARIEALSKEEKLDPVKQKELEDLLKARDYVAEKVNGSKLFEFREDGTTTFMPSELVKKHGFNPDLFKAPQEILRQELAMLKAMKGDQIKAYGEGGKDFSIPKEHVNRVAGALVDAAKTSHGVTGTYKEAAQKGLSTIEASVLSQMEAYLRDYERPNLALLSQAASALDSFRDRSAHINSSKDFANSVPKGKSLVEAQKEAQRALKEETEGMNLLLAHEKDQVAKRARPEAAQAEHDAAIARLVADQEAKQGLISLVTFAARGTQAMNRNAKVKDMEPAQREKFERALMQSWVLFDHGSKQALKDPKLQDKLVEALANEKFDEMMENTPEARKKLLAFVEKFAKEHLDKDGKGTRERDENTRLLEKLCANCPDIVKMCPRK